MLSPSRRWVLVLAACLGGCVARNPTRESLRPVQPAPGVEQPADPEPVASEPESEFRPLVLEGSDPAGDGETEPAPADAGGEVPAPLVVAEAAGRPVEARGLLARLWLRNPGLVREELEQLVLEELVFSEAARLSLYLPPERVEAEVTAAWGTLEAEIRAAGSTLTVDDYIQEVLNLDPEFYARNLRRRTITHLIAERVMRAFSMGQERAVVQLLEFEHRAEVESFVARLDAGAAFSVLAAERSPALEPRELVLVRSEHSTLSRLAFATEVGGVGGPVPESGRWIVLHVDRRIAPIEGTWDELAGRIDRELEERPIEDPEYWQWKAAMQRRYAVDLGPFFDLIEIRRP